jgi:hypothetical protein
MFPGKLYNCLVNCLTIRKDYFLNLVAALPVRMIEI